MLSPSFHLVTQFVARLNYCSIAGKFYSLVDNVFKASALLAHAFYKSKCPYVCLCVCVFVCVFTFEVEVVPKKISDYQVSEKIHSKAGAEENIIMEIPLWTSAAENV